MCAASTSELFVGILDLTSEAVGRIREVDVAIGGDNEVIRAVESKTSVAVRKCRLFSLRSCQRFELRNSAVAMLGQHEAAIAIDGKSVRSWLGNVGTIPLSVKLRRGVPDSTGAPGAETSEGRR